jgi:hypothetical protein
MPQVGAWVPATSFRLSPADAIFVRMVSMPAHAAEAPLLCDIARVAPQLPVEAALPEVLWDCAGGAGPHPVGGVHLLCGAVRDSVHAAGAHWRPSHDLWSLGTRACSAGRTASAPSQLALRFWKQSGCACLTVGGTVAGSNRTQHGCTGRARARHSHHRWRRYCRRCVGAPVYQRPLPVLNVSRSSGCSKLYAQQNMTALYSSHDSAMTYTIQPDWCQLLLSAGAYSQRTIIGYRTSMRWTPGWLFATWRAM